MPDLLIIKITVIRTKMEIDSYVQEYIGESYSIQFTPYHPSSIVPGVRYSMDTLVRG